MRSEQSGLPGSGSSKRGRSAFLITIDTEGDDLWSKPKEITVRNAETLPRFQELCERYGLRPTYLANWEMANSGAFVEFGKNVLAKNAAEIAMEQRRDYVEFMLHSSELMAGGSPTFATSDRIERLFDDLEALFDAARQDWTGATLSEYRDTVRPAAGGRPEAT